jgi:signal transduction histidine kinase
MRRDVEPAAIRTVFRYHRTADTAPEEVVGERAFFSKSDFDNADHTFEGHVDERGNFKGRVRIFDENVEYALPSPWGDREITMCGPFSIGFAYIQGNPRESRLFAKDPAEYGVLRGRVDKFGGIYIYRDGIRILPYGNADFDFLGIETRRNKGATYYFFAYRRMFGTIDLTREANGDLHEKAGREGFRENKAYRQLKHICENLLVQLAAEFFRQGSPQNEVFEKQKSQFAELELVRRRREAEAREKRSEFERRTNEVLAAISEGAPTIQSQKFVEAAERRLKGARMRTGASGDEAAKRIIAVERELLSEFDALVASFRVTKPRGIGLTQKIRRDYASYLSEFEQLQRDVFTPAAARIEALTSEAAREARSAIERRQWIEASLQQAIASGSKDVRSAKSEVEQALSALSAGVTDAVRTALQETDQVVASTLQRIEALELASLGEREFSRIRSEAETTIRNEASRRAESLRQLLGLIEVAAASLRGGTGTHPEEVTAALEEELLALREREAADIELTQLGTAIEVINHEFSSTIKQVRDGLKTLGVWAKEVDDLKVLYERLRTAFDHLDGYLTLFTPLQRRLYRSRVTIRGATIAAYIADLFRQRLERHQVELVITPQFRKHSFRGYPSSFFPVFVNLVDNALFWLSDRRGVRRVTIDSAGPTMIVSDTGPGVAKRDRDAIFERGFTRKPSGRGLGLFIARAVLRKEGYEISLAGSNAGAAFEIRPLSDHIRTGTQR